MYFIVSLFVLYCIIIILLDLTAQRLLGLAKELWLFCCETV